MKTFTALALLLATGASLVGSAPVKARGKLRTFPLEVFVF